MCRTVGIFLWPSWLPAVPFMPIAPFQFLAFSMSTSIYYNSIRYQMCISSQANCGACTICTKKGRNFMCLQRKQRRRVAIVALAAALKATQHLRTLLYLYDYGLYWHRTSTIEPPSPFSMRLRFAFAVCGVCRVGGDCMCVCWCMCVLVLCAVLNKLLLAAAVSSSFSCRKMRLPGKNECATNERTDENLMFEKE